MPDISFDDLIPGQNAAAVSAPAPSMPGTVVEASTDAHPMFADLIPGSTGRSPPNLPSSRPAGVSPPDAMPSHGDDGRSFDLRRSSAPPTPDAPTWLGRRVQDIEGRQDPAYADVPSVFSQNSDILQAPTGTAAMLGASDEQMADVMKKHLGDRYIGMTKDANGYPLIQFKDATTGQPKIGYVNKPGLDSEDVVRGVKGALPYAAVGEILGPVIGGYSLLSRMFLQGTGGAAMSAGGDKALESLGSEQGIDKAKAGTMMMLGPLAEAGGAGVKALWDKFVAIPKYFDKSTGQLTPLGRQAAQKMGLDPDQMASDAMSTFGKTYAMNPADAKAAVDAGNFDFNIPATRGQLGKDPQQLLQEKAMRSGLYGLEAKAQIEDLDRRQAEAVATAVTDTIPSRMAGRPWRGGSNPEVYGSNIAGNLKDAQKNAKAAERAAWTETGPITPKTVTTQVPDAMTPITGVSKSTQTMGGADMLKAELSANLEPLSGVISQENTPAAFGMWKYLNEFMAGRKPSTALHDSLGLSGARDLDSVRRGLRMMSTDAKTQTDKAAAGAIYKSYNDWIEKAANAQLLTGDAVVAAKLKAARDVSAQMNNIFRPMKNGKLTPGGRILERIAGSADTPERIVDALIPSPNAAIPDGTIEALGLVRRAMQTYGNAGADEQVWNSVKVAWLSKLTQGRNGEFLSPHVMSQNLRKAMTSQASLFNTVFEPADKAVLGRFLTQLDRINWKDPNPSGTATSLAGLGKQVFGKILDAFGPIGRAAWDYSGVQHAWGSSIARQAVKQAPRVSGTVPENAMTTYANALAAPAAINNALAIPPQRSADTDPRYGNVLNRYLGAP